MKAFSYRKQSRYTVLVFIYSTLPVHKFPLNLLLLRLWYVPCSAPLSTCTCLSPHMPLCCNYLFVPASYASVFLLCPVLGTQELTLEWERERRGSGREKNWKKKKKSNNFQQTGSIATWQLSPPVCEKLSSGREPRSACLSCGRALGTVEQKRMWWNYGSGSSMGALPPGTAVLSPPPPPPLSPFP